jgi:hypothetical protein
MDMRRREFGCVLALCARASAQVRMSAASEENGLTISGLRLRDNPVWVVRQSGPIAPLRVEVTLCNTTGESLPVWDPTNSEGSRSLRLLLTASNGKQVTLIPPGVERSGVPTAVEIAAGGELTITVDLAEMHGARSLEAGNWRGRVSYRNKQPATGPVRKVWMGEISGPEFEFQVARR